MRMPRFMRALVAAAIGVAAISIGPFNQNDGTQDWQI
ncbi:hypothetical protein FHU31_005326 [Mycolicibacterium fluoranthenivorans]|jgi:hypothetical protein|uniref:Uncharacterized protein n=1 Tax=Mycolicibacterium fluoranthenivorans TaxID=258505 RepID=A0A7X5ZFM3_9MYCO|nr:hypothetical protein [Mycolicibacterium fluoranthenivorans]